MQLSRSSIIQIRKTTAPSDQQVLLQQTFYNKTYTKSYTKPKNLHKTYTTYAKITQHFLHQIQKVKIIHQIKSILY